jgi:hypothetical protein
MDIVDKIVEQLNKLPPIFYDSTKKKENAQSIEEIREIVANEVKNYTEEQTEREIALIKKQLLKVHK